MPKSGDDDMKQLGSDATQALGPLMKQCEKGFKMATMLVKSPNPKVAEAVADIVEEIIADAADLKKLLKELKSAAK